MKIKPIVKWAGGKSKLADQIIRMIPKDIKTYYEPFLGGGAVLLNLQPERAVINDLCEDLICLYKAVVNDPDFLMRLASAMVISEDEYYRIRALDRDDNYLSWTYAQRGARLLYLNHLCFNGLYRVNKSGFFNVPYGKYKNPRIYNRENILNLSQYLRKDNIFILNTDFAVAVLDAGPGDFIYFDPPYHPISKTSSFTGYGEGGFGAEDQVKLKLLCDEMTSRGVKWIQSNSSAELITDLYKSEYFLHPIKAARSINADAAGRGEIKEYLICNYEAAF